jgi:hypothetical protein
MTSGVPEGYFKSPTVARVQDHLDGGTEVRSLLTSWTPLEADGPVATTSWRRPPHLHPCFDHSHAYAILASPGDRTS